MATQEPEVKAVPGSFNERWWLNRRRHRQRPDGVVGGDEPRARAEWFLSSRSGIEGHTCRVQSYGVTAQTSTARRIRHGDRHTRRS